MGVSFPRPDSASVSRAFEPGASRWNATTRSLPAYGPEGTPNTDPRVPSVRYIRRRG